MHFELKSTTVSLKIEPDIALYLDNTDDVGIREIPLPEILDFGWMRKSELSTCKIKANSTPIDSQFATNSFIDF